MTQNGNPIASELQAAIVTSDGAPIDAARAALKAAGIGVVACVGLDQHAAALEARPDVVVLRHDAGATRRATFIKQLRQASDAHIVVIGDDERGHGVRSAMEAGASGFVFESEIAVSLAATVRVAVAGQVAVPRRARRQVERPTLSGREKQILGLVVMGYMNCEIADELFLAESTVKSHLSSAFAKLGVRSRNEAVDLILDKSDGLGRGILAVTPALAASAPMPS